MESTVKELQNGPILAIVGVTGAVGAEFIATMDKRAFRVGKLKALASARSAGKTLDFRGRKVVIEELNENSFAGVDIALFSAGGGISRKFAPIAVKAGAVVVDNSSAFRMDPNVPLVIPEINASRIAEHKGIIANPNCCRDHRAGAAMADPQDEPHQAPDPLDLSGGQRRGEPRRWRNWWNSTRASSDGKSYQPKVMPAPLRLQPLQPQFGDRSGDRLQRRRDQGHQGDPEDLRGRPDRASA